MRTAGDRHRRGFIRLQQDWDDRLRDQSNASSSADVEPIITALDLSRLELQLHRPDSSLGYLRAADFGNGLHTRQVLTLQSRLLASGTDLHELDLRSRDRAQAQRGAENLSTTLAHRPVDCHKVFHMKHPSPAQSPRGGAHGCSVRSRPGVKGIPRNRMISFTP